MRRCTGKPKPLDVRVFGTLHVMRRWPFAVQPGMLVALPGLPGFLALTIDGGPLQMARLIYPDS